MVELIENVDAFGELGRLKVRESVLGESGGDRENDGVVVSTSGVG